MKKNIIKPEDISIQSNADGIGFFKGLDYSAWTILVEINELPYRIRKNNVMLCGLWYGIKKPAMNVSKTIFGRIKEVEWSWYTMFNLWKQR